MHARPHTCGGAKNASGYGSALEGAERDVETGVGSPARYWSGLVRGRRKWVVRLHQKQRYCFGGEGGAYFPSTDEAALQPSCGQAAARLYSRSSPSSLVVTVT